MDPIQDLDCQQTVDLLINWSTSELNTLLDPTTYLDYTDRWIQLDTAPTMAMTSWIQMSTCILNSNWTGGARPPVSVDGKMHVDSGIQLVTAIVGAVTRWIQQSV